MPTRVIAFLLAFVLLWSGLSTIEAPRITAAPASEQTTSLLDAADPANAHAGSVEHHHLDDLPSQAQSDPPPDTPGLLPAPLAPSVQWTVMVQPQALAAAETRPPFLAGPLRPPRANTIAG
ncbi:MAG: hypothetical protein V4795_11215 [Pseudomonadota bacterium]